MASSSHCAAVRRCEPADAEAGVQTVGSSKARTALRFPVAGAQGDPKPCELGMDEAAWDRFSRGSAIRRAHGAGLIRNVAVALGNWRRSP